MKLNIKHQKYTKINYHRFISSKHYFSLIGIIYYNRTENSNLIIYKR